MAGEVTVPLLPCVDLDETAGFAECLGFRSTYRQTRPNPYLAVRREDLQLHWFGLPGLRPEDSYSSCLVLVPDPGLLFEAFAGGLRARYGKLPLTGFPRVTRPRRRRNADGQTGFSLVDPSGNWIRVMRADAPAGAEEPETRLGRSLADAVVLADSKGDVAQAVKVLTGALRRSEGERATAERAEALAYLAELSVRGSDPTAARVALAELDRLELGPEERVAAAPALAQAVQLRADLGAG